MSDELHSLRAIDEILARHDADEVRRMLGWLTDKHVGPAACAPDSREPSGASFAEPRTDRYADPDAGRQAGSRATPNVTAHAGSSTRPATESGAESSTGASAEASTGFLDEAGVGTFDLTAAASDTPPVVPVGIADVDFAPEGKPDAKGYNDVWGSPDDDRVKCLEAVHWFEAVGEVPAVTPEHVHAYFVEKGWEVPDDLLDTIGRAGVKGYLSADEPTDLRVAPKGHRLMASSLSYADP